MGGANRGAALRAGSDAMVACEPRQGRKTATVSLMFHVPSGRLAGALTAARKPMSIVEREVHDHIFGEMESE